MAKMSGGGNGFRVSAIPSNVRKIIQNIKEIGSNHSDEEIYAMLKECGMDPNETAQKLLLQDTFHEVKSKRDRKKENLNSRETADSRRRSGPPGRVGRGQGSFSSRQPADAGGGKHSVSATENGIKQASESAGSNSPASAVKDKNNKETASAGSLTLLDNGSILMASGGNADEHTSHVSSITSAKHSEASTAEQSLIGATEKFSVESGAGVTNENGQLHPSSRKSLRPAAGTSLGHRLAWDPVLVQSNESRHRGAIGAVKHDIGCQRSHVEPNTKFSAEGKLNAAYEIRSSAHAKMGSKSHGAGKNQLIEFSRPSSSSGYGGSACSRPSSNYGSNYSSRSQQVIGPLKGSSKEWKPKITNSSIVLVSRASAGSQHSSSAAKTGEQDHDVHYNVSDSEEPASKVEKELEGLHIKDTQQVIIPNHIHVPEAVRTGLNFGSFDTAVVINLTHGNNSKSKKCSEHISESYQAVEDSVMELAVSNDNVMAPAVEEDSIDHLHSFTHVPENVSSSNADVRSSSVSGFDNLKETSSVPQHPLVHTSPAYSFAVVPTPVQGNITPSDNSDTQAHDASRVPNFVVQQPIDPASASIYARFYHSGEGDGHVSPFPLPGVSARYNGNAAVFPAQTSESPQEGGNPVALSTTGQTPLANQAGVMPNTITVAQQAVPVFRQPPSLPMPHYPTNYIPYGHYISPFYVPPPAIHQVLSNNAFLQQAQAGSVYPGPPTGAAFPQFRRGSNSGNPTQMGRTGSYGPYETSPAGYNAGSAVAAAAGNSTTNEDPAGSQYSAGQQTEGSAVWVAAPGRDISGLQANSFYNLPLQGQHVTFTPSLGGHGSFASVYHPAQAVTASTMHPLLQQSQAMPGTIDMVGAAPGSVYQQSQHATQMNWPNNY